MVKPKLYFIDISPASRSVLLTAKALNIDLELIPVNTLAGEQHKPEFVKINPQHTVPTLDDDGKILWDSHAICTYLATEHGNAELSLCPKDNFLRAKMDQRLHFNSGTLFSRYYRCVIPVFQGSETEYKAEDLQAVFESLDFLEAFLKDDDYLVGNSLSVADFCCLTSVTTIFKIIIVDLGRYPKILAWAARLSMLPYYADIDLPYLEKIDGIYRRKLNENRTIKAKAT